MAARKPKPFDFRAEVGSGDERRALEAMRSKLAEAMELAEPSVIAQVAARLQAVVARIAELDDAAEPEVSPTDDIARKRAARRAAAQVGEAAAGGGVKRRGGSGRAG